MNKDAVRTRTVFSCPAAVLVAVHLLSGTVSSSSLIKKITPFIIDLIYKYI